ncbi:hypothetical protein DH2020_014335 [Rehmannia glutinosa]|uniref:Retrotransposon gag domain-containing protein n=1 Tax=Rehmannia glutinosa TaxID=99300 RepID=A0ABR0WWU7_REHGL
MKDLHRTHTRDYLQRCTDAQRVICADYQLVEDVDRWWEGYWQTRPKEECDAKTWREFKEIITSQYHPRFYRDQMEREFLYLTQGGMTVLSRFAAHLINSDLKKTQRFLGGLRAGIRHILTSHGDLIYAETLKRAQGIAASQNMERKQAEFTSKRIWQGSNQSDDENKKPNEQGREEGKMGSSMQTSKLLCSNCGRNHNGECLLGQDKCYRCKVSGHVCYTCTTAMLNPGKKRVSSGGKARVYVMTQNDSNQSE